jgi:hypothetical protein
MLKEPELVLDRVIAFLGHDPKLKRRKKVRLNVRLPCRDVPMNAPSGLS